MIKEKNLLGCIQGKYSNSFADAPEKISLCLAGVAFWILGAGVESADADFSWWPGGGPKFWCFLQWSLGIVIEQLQHRTGYQERATLISWGSLILRQLEKPCWAKTACSSLFSQLTPVAVPQNEIPGICSCCWVMVKADSRGRAVQHLGFLLSSVDKPHSLPCQLLLVRVGEISVRVWGQSVGFADPPLPSCYTWPSNNTGWLWENPCEDIAEPLKLIRKFFLMGAA